MKILLKYVGLGVCFAFIAGCSPKMRLERIVRNHPEVIQNIQSDTSMVTSYDTLRIAMPGIDTTIYLRDTLILHDSVGTITIYKEVEGKIRVVTEYRPMVFPVERKIVVVSRKQTITVADHPPDKWKYRKQGALMLFVFELLLIITLFLIKSYFKQFKVKFP